MTRAGPETARTGSTLTAPTLTAVWERRPCSTHRARAVRALSTTTWAPRPDTRYTRPKLSGRSSPCSFSSPNGDRSSERRSLWTTQQLYKLPRYVPLLQVDTLLTCSMTLCRSSGKPTRAFGLLYAGFPVTLEWRATSGRTQRRRRRLAGDLARPALYRRASARPSRSAPRAHVRTSSTCCRRRQNRSGRSRGADDGWQRSTVAYRQRLTPSSSPRYPAATLTSFSSCAQDMSPSIGTLSA